MKLPVRTELEIKVGNMEVKKGMVRDMTLFGWDSVEQCSDTKCKLYNECGFIKQGACGVQVKYLEAFMSTVLTNYTHLDNMCLYQIGMHLLPLYSQLCKMKLVEKGLKGQVMVETRKGGLTVHPIYKEIRSTMLAINGEWRRLELFRNGFELEIDLKQEKVERKEGKVIDLEKGDAGYYKSISRDSGVKRSIIR